MARLLLAAVLLVASPAHAPGEPCGVPLSWDGQGYVCDVGVVLWDT